MDFQYTWVLDRSSNEYYYWEPRDNTYVYESGRRVLVPNQAVVSQQRDVSPRTPHLPPAVPVGGSADSPASPGAQRYIYGRRGTNSSSNDSHPNVGLGRSIPSQQQLSTSPPQHPTGTAHMTALASTFAGSSLNRPPNTGITPYPGPSSGPSTKSVESNTLWTSSSVCIAPEQAAEISGKTYGYVRDTSNEQFEQLDPRFKRRTRKENQRFFKRGRVFKVHWSAPGGATPEDTFTSAPSSSRVRSKQVIRDPQFGQPIYSKIRWFIVVKASSNKCICVSIVTYGDRGVSKPSAIKSEHAIAYTGATAPAPHPREEPSSNDERPMQRAIRIRPDNPGDKLEPMSRIDYARLFTVEHNIKAMAFGHVHDDSEEDFFYTFKRVLFPEDDDDEDDDEDDDDDDEDDDDVDENDNDNNVESSSDEDPERQNSGSDETRVPHRRSNNSKRKLAINYPGGTAGPPPRFVTRADYQKPQAQGASSYQPVASIYSSSSQQQQNAQQLWNQQQTLQQAQSVALQQDRSQSRLQPQALPQLQQYPREQQQTQLQQAQQQAQQQQQRSSHTMTPPEQRAGETSKRQQSSRSSRKSKR